MAYDPNKSQINEDTLAAFLQDEIQAELTSLPGVGPASKQLLIHEGIHTTFQLLGKYCSFVGGNKAMTPQDRMFFWLKSIGIASHRNTIINAISEKMSIMMPELDQTAHNK